VTDTAIGFGILGMGILLVLAIVFAVTLRAGGGTSSPPRPPRGVHLPPPSMLPVILSIGAALIAAGLVFRNDGLLALPEGSFDWGLVVAALGLLVLVYGIVSWVAAAGREWRDTERGSHDEPSGH
jgi:hypothetical protein